MQPSLADEGSSSSQQRHVFKSLLKRSCLVHRHLLPLIRDREHVPSELSLACGHTADLAGKGRPLKLGHSPTAGDPAEQADGPVPKGRVGGKEPRCAYQPMSPPWALLGHMLCSLASAARLASPVRILAAMDRIASSWSPFIRMWDTYSS